MDPVDATVRHHSPAGSLGWEQARATTKLQDGDTLGAFDEQLARRLYSFVTTQRIRTKSVQLDIELSGGDFLRDAIEDDMDADRYEDRIIWTTDLSDQEKADILFEAVVQGIHHRLIVQGIFGYMTIADLETVMLCNVTDTEFVISDTPVILDNPRFKRQYELVRAGLANRGFQILCPLGPRRVLLIYDPVVYRVKERDSMRIPLKSLEGEVRYGVTLKCYRFPQQFSVPLT